MEGRYKDSSYEKNPESMIKNGYLDKDYGLCFPVLNVIYERSYYLVRNIRLTLDKKIVYKKVSSGQISNFSTFDNSNVLELKFNSEDLVNSVIKNYVEEKEITNNLLIFGSLNAKNIILSEKVANFHTHLCYFEIPFFGFGRIILSNHRKSRIISLIIKIN